VTFACGLLPSHILIAVDEFDCQRSLRAVSGAVERDPLTQHPSAAIVTQAA